MSVLHSFVLLFSRFSILTTHLGWYRFFVMYKFLASNTIDNMRRGEERGEKRDSREGDKR